MQSSPRISTQTKSPLVLERHLNQSNVQRESNLRNRKEIRHGIMYTVMQKRDLGGDIASLSVEYNSI